MAPAVIDGSSQEGGGAHPLQRLAAWSPSYLLVSWLESMFAVGKQRALTASDVPSLPDALSSSKAQSGLNASFILLLSRQGSEEK